MGKRKQAEESAPIGRIDALKSGVRVGSAVRRHLHNLKRKREWTVDDLAETLQKIAAAVGVELGSD